jgi:hypothetical protein
MTGIDVAPVDGIATDATGPTAAGPSVDDLEAAFPVVALGPGEDRPPRTPHDRVTVEAYTTTRAGAPYRTRLRMTRFEAEARGLAIISDPQEGP